MTTDQTRTVAEQRLSRRGALRAGGLGMVASLGSGGLSRALAQDATPTAAMTGEEPAQDGLAVEVIELIKALPGTKALKFWAPPDAGRTPRTSDTAEPGRWSGGRVRAPRPGRAGSSGSRSRPA